MRVLFLSPGTDICGLGESMARAFRRYTDWQARSVAKMPSPYAYPAGEPWSKVTQLFRWADVVHVMDNPGSISAYPWKGKRIVVHHLGTRYRQFPDRMNALCQAVGAFQVTASPDDDRLPWLPAIIDFDGLAGKRVATGERVRVVHAPTHRGLKSTDIIAATMARLDVDFEIIEGVPWAECIARKARADILVDELTLGYGLNALECWAMRIPVVSGIADPDARARLLRRTMPEGILPFIEATADTLEAKVRELLDPKVRLAWGQRGAIYARRYHDGPAVVERAIEFYGAA